MTENKATRVHVRDNDRAGHAAIDSSGSGVSAETAVILIDVDDVVVRIQGRRPRLVYAVTATTPAHEKQPRRRAALAIAPFCRTAIELFGSS